MDINLWQNCAYNFINNAYNKSFGTLPSRIPYVKYVDLGMELTFVCEAQSALAIIRLACLYCFCKGYKRKRALSVRI